MDIYLVRHGETDSNHKHVHQHPGSTLNDKGREQVARLAITLSEIEPTDILASPYSRAKESADILAKTLNLEVVVSPELVEIYRPKNIHGLSYYHPRSLIYLGKWFFSGRRVFNNDEQGESYASLIERIEKSRDLLESLPADSRVVVVSHAVFISFFVAHLCDHKTLSLWRVFLNFANIRRLKNSGVTHLRYVPSSGQGVCKWSLVEFNKDKHLKG